MAVTGTPTGRDCTLVAPTQVRCIDTVSPGLLPGTTLDPTTPCGTAPPDGSGAIEFPDGPPPGLAVPVNAPGLKEYRDWVNANAPE